MRTPTIVILLASALGLSACGSAGSAAASRPQPPSPVVLSVYIGPSAVRISPARIGGGPVLLTVTNESAHSVALLLTRSGHSGALARTTPINPQGDTQLKVDVSRGSYAVEAVPGGRRTEAQRTLPQRIAATTLRVGAERKSSGSQLLQP